MVRGLVRVHEGALAFTTRKAPLIFLPVKIQIEQWLKTMAQTFYDVSASRGLVRKLVNPVRMTVPQPSRRRGEKRRLRLVLGNRKGMPEVFTFLALLALVQRYA